MNKNLSDYFLFSGGTFKDLEDCMILICHTFLKLPLVSDQAGFSKWLKSKVTL